MKTFLAAATVLSLAASGAFAECGHDMVQSKPAETVASVDMSTTASTVKTDETKAETPPTVETE